MFDQSQNRLSPFPEILVGLHVLMVRVMNKTARPEGAMRFHSTTAATLETYLGQRRAEWKKIAQTLDEQGIPLEDNVVADIGCGPGALSWMFLNEGKAKLVLGVDIDQKELDKAPPELRENPNISLQHCNGTDFPIAENSVDIIICNDVLEHVSPETFVSFIEGLRRILKPGGVMLLRTISWGNHSAHHNYGKTLPWMHAILPEPWFMRSLYKVYHADWYTPTFNEVDKDGNKLRNRHNHSRIPREYLNCYWLNDFLKGIHTGNFSEVSVILEPMGPLKKIPGIKHLYALSCKYPGVISRLPEVLSGSLTFCIKK